MRLDYEHEVQMDILTPDETCLCESIKLKGINNPEFDRALLTAMGEITKAKDEGRLEILARNADAGNTLKMVTENYQCKIIFSMSYTYLVDVLTRRVIGIAGEEQNEKI